MITVIGLGPGPYDLLSLRAARIIETADLVLLRTARHPAVSDLPAGVRRLSYDNVYEQSGDFGTVYDRIVSDLIGRAAAGQAVVYAVPGDPSLGEESVRRLLERAAVAAQEVEFVPGVSFLSAVLAAGPGSASSHLQLIDALQPIEPNPLVPLVVYQVHDRAVASTVKLELLRLYPPGHLVTVVQGGPVAAATAVPLAELDRRGSFDHLTSLYLGPLQPEQALASPFGLRAIVHRLRAPGGCPWDREQTHASLRRYLLEEAFEAVDAIDDGDPHDLRDELGDVLLQVYLQAELAEESGDFDLTDVIRGLSEKLIRRHPHVFAGLEVASAAEVERNWDQLKRVEKGQGPQAEVPSALKGIPRSMPALSRAQEVQRKLSKAGFDWTHPPRVLAKLDEEIAELKAAADDPRAFGAELGDVLFMLAKLATDRGLDAEAALRGTIARVEQRFGYLEQAAATRGCRVRDLDLQTQLDLWVEAKRHERHQPS